MTDATSSPRSVLVALRVLEALADLQPIGVGELARQLELPKSTVQRTLRALDAAGWASPEGEMAKWSLTMKSFRVGVRAFSDVDLVDVALVEMRALHDELDDAIHLTVLDGREILIVEKLDSPQPVRAWVDRGASFPAHCSASGKAILAFSTDAVIDEFLSQPLPRVTAATITDPKRFRRELDEVRRVRYAVSIGENNDEIAVVAAPIIAQAGTPIAALALTGTSTRLTPDLLAPIGIRLAESAARVSRRLGWSPT